MQSKVKEITKTLHLAEVKDPVTELMFMALWNKEQWDLSVNTVVLPKLDEVFFTIFYKEYKESLINAIKGQIIRDWENTK